MSKYTPVATDPMEVVAALEHAQRLRQAREDLDDKLIEGLRSGPPVAMENLPWEELTEIISSKHK